MKKFLAIYIGSASASEKAEWKQSTPEADLKALEISGMEAWSNWVMANAESITDYGTPLGQRKRVSAQGIEDIENQIVAYTIVQAESHEAAAKLFENHPHFAIFPGDSVEVIECLPMPEMPEV